MLKQKLKQFVKKHDLTNLIYQLLLLNRIEETKGWYHHFQLEDVLRFHHFGPENPDKNLYLIQFNQETYGFFALWNIMLYRIDYAEQFHLTPVVVWKERTPYWEPSLHANAYENYFEPLSGISTESALNSRNVVRARGDVIDRSKEFALNGYQSAFLPQNLTRFAELHKKYVRVKPEIQEQIQVELTQLLGDKKTLAVHIRGVDWGNVKGHPIPVALEEYIRLIDEAMERHGFEQVFLATDSDDTVAEMKRRYGNRLVCYCDIIRTKAGSHTLAIFEQENQGNLRRFRMGYEVLRDMMALSQSEGLIAGFSNVALAAKVWKLAEEKDYSYFHLIQNEIQTKGLSSKESIKKCTENKME